MTLDKEIIAKARQKAEKDFRSLSAWIEKAIEMRLEIDTGLTSEPVLSQPLTPKKRQGWTEQEIIDMEDGKLDYCHDDNLDEDGLPLCHVRPAIGEVYCKKHLHR